MEKVVFDQLYSYFEQNDLFYDSQHGYRKKHSTETACLEFVDSIHRNLELGKLPISFFLDLSKAFDTLDHKILLAKLKYYGLNTTALSWFTSYLSNRKQFVEIDDAKSTITDVNTGVPQGSILGPLLFIIYMNDINTVSEKFEFVLYADDTSLTTTICTFNLDNDVKHLSNNINNELALVNDWLVANKLSLNIGKTKFMIFHYPQLRDANIPKLEIYINGICIQRTEKMDFLGLTVTDTMSWNDHCNKISVKISKVIGILCRTKRILDPSVRLKIYNALILPHLHYCVLCWGFSNKRVNKLQKKAVRLVCNAKYNAHTDPLYKSMNILKTADIFDLQCIKFFYKYEHDSLPSYFRSIYQTNRDIHNHNTRQSSQLHLFPVRRQRSKNTIRHYIPNLINSLPNSIKDMIETHSLATVKIAVKKHYIEQYAVECVIPDCYICKQNQ